MCDVVVWLATGRVACSCDAVITSRFHNRLDISRQAKRLLAAQEEHCSVELVLVSTMKGKNNLSSVSRCDEYEGSCLLRYFAIYFGG